MASAHRPTIAALAARVRLAAAPWRAGARDRGARRRISAIGRRTPGFRELALHPENARIPWCAWCAKIPNCCLFRFTAMLA